MASPSLRAFKIVAIGKNYMKHVAEMGGKAAKAPEAPIFFLKPASSVISSGEAIVIPSGVGEVHHEVELGLVIGKRARKLAVDAPWREYVSGYVLALDMTARDLQAKAKLAGLPWTASKCYDTFTPLSPLIAAARIADPYALELYLTVDGQARQRGSTADMIHRIPAMLHAVTAVMTLEEGDVILTGTPDGVGPVRPGQTVKAGITGIIDVTYPVVAEV